MILASIESFLGSLWFGIALLAIGYIGGNLVPFSSLTGFVQRLFTKKP